VDPTFDAAVNSPSLDGNVFIFFVLADKFNGQTLIKAVYRTAMKNLLWEIYFFAFLVKRTLDSVVPKTTKTAREKNVARH